jgi:hypothetical protein
MRSCLLQFLVILAVVDMCNLLIMSAQVTWYHPIAEDDMNVVMEYNCDYRRYTRATYAQHSGKKPRFYKSAESADRNFGTSIRKAIVVLKVASTSMPACEECCKDWDTEYYPDYIVVLRE